MHTYPENINNKQFTACQNPIVKLFKILAQRTFLIIISKIFETQLILFTAALRHNLLDYTQMTNIVLLLLVFLTFILSLSNLPTDCLVAQHPTTIPLTSGEIRFLDLSSIFSGKNLKITSNLDKNTTVNDSVYKVAETKITDPIPKNSIWAILRALTDWRGGWGQRVAAIYQVTFGSVFVNIGNRTSQNYEFSQSKMEIKFGEDTKCLDAIFINDLQILLDCHEVNANNSIILLFESSTLKTSKFKTSFSSSRRKLIKLQTSDGYARILQVQLTQNGASSSIIVLKANSSHDMVYFNQTSVELIIDAKYLNLSSLKITDVVTDEAGYIYLAQKQTGVYKLQYKASGLSAVASVIGFLPFNSNVQSLAIVKVKKNFHLYVQLTQHVVMIKNFETTIQNPFYQAAGETRKRIYANQHGFVIQTTQNYHFHIATEEGNSQVVTVITKGNSLIAVDATSARVLMVQSAASKNLQFSRGYLLINKITSNATLILSAVSNSPNHTQTCSASIELVLVSDTKKIFEIQSGKTFEIDFYQNLDFHIQNYYEGARLREEITQNSELVSLTNNTKSISIPKSAQNKELIPNPTIRHTHSYSSNQYLRLVAQNENFYLQNCKLSSSTDKIQTQELHSQKLNDSIKLIKPAYTSDSFDGDTPVPAIGYVLQTTPKILQLVTVNNHMMRSYTYPGNVTDFINTKDDCLIVLSFNDTASQFVTVYFFRSGGWKIAYINQKFFDEVEEVKQFRPRAMRYDEESNMLYIINLNQLIVIGIGDRMVSYVIAINLDEMLGMDSSADWDVATYDQHILIIVSEPTNRVFNYRILPTSQIIFLGKVDLFDEVLPQPLSVQRAGQFAFIGAGSNGIIVIKVNQPILSKNYDFLNIRKSHWFTATALDDVVVVEMRSVDDSSSITNLYYRTPSISITTSLQNNQKQLKKKYQLKFNIKGYQQQQISSSLEIYLFNHQLKIQAPRNFKQNVYLPEQASNKTIELDIDSFTGNVIEYRLQCPFCNLNNVVLVQPFYKIQNRFDFVIEDLISFRDGRVWYLSDNKIYFSKNNEQMSLSLNTSMLCSKFVQIDEENVLLFCKNSQLQQFINIGFKDQRQPQQLNTFKINLNYSISTIKKSVSLENRLFLLNNNQNGNGEGIIRVFNLSFKNKIVNNVTGQITLNYNSFNFSKKQPIQGFTVFQMNTTTSIIMCTMDQGIIYGNYNSNSTSFDLKNKAYYDLNENDYIRNYVMKNNRYIQIQLIDSNPQNNQHILIMTSSKGAHLQIKIRFTTSFSIQSIQVENTYYKYGSQITMNNIFVSSIHPQTNDRLIIIPYQNIPTNLITFAIYKMQKTSSATPHRFKAGIQVPSDQFKSAFFYRNEQNNTVLVVSTPQSLTTKTTNNSNSSIYNISMMLGLILNYSNFTGQSHINITAVNQYFQALCHINVNPHSNKLQWYFILLIVVGGIVIIGGSIGIWWQIKKRKRATSANSLLIDSAQQI